MSDYQRFRPKSGKPYVLMIPEGADFPEVPGAQREDWVADGTYSGLLSTDERRQLGERGYSLVEHKNQFTETEHSDPSKWPD